MTEVTKRLRSWSSRNLSFAGRLQLISSILHTFHIYWAQVFMIPKGVLDEIDAICRQFLSSGHQPKHCPTLVNWHDVCRENKYGGLWLNDIRIWNTTAIGKLVWDLSSTKDSLWVHWISGVYLRDADFWQHQCPPNCSWYWKQIYAVRDSLVAGYVNQKWVVDPSGHYTVASGYCWLIWE